MSLEKDIARVDDLLEKFKKIREEYPRSFQYKRIVFQLEDERAKLADNIGRNNGHPKQKRP